MKILSVNVLVANAHVQLYRQHDQGLAEISNIVSEPPRFLEMPLPLTGTDVAYFCCHGQDVFLPFLLNRARW